MLGLDKHVVPQEKKKSAKVIKVVSSEALCLRIPNYPAQTMGNYQKNTPVGFITSMEFAIR